MPWCEAVRVVCALSGGMRGIGRGHVPMVSDGTRSNPGANNGVELNEMYFPLSLAQCSGRAFDCRGFRAYRIVAGSIPAAEIAYNLIKLLHRSLIFLLPLGTSFGPQTRAVFLFGIHQELLLHWENACMGACGFILPSWRSHGRCPPSQPLVGAVSGAEMGRPLPAPKYAKVANLGHPNATRSFISNVSNPFVNWFDRHRSVLGSEVLTRVDLSKPVWPLRPLLGATSHQITSPWPFLRANKARNTAIGTF